MIRRARHDDVRDIALLISEVNDIHIRLEPERYKRTTDSYNADFVREFLDDVNNVVFVAEVGSHVVGAAFISVNRGDCNGPRTDYCVAYVNTIVVSSSHKRQGIGIALMNESERAARDAGCTAVRLNVANENRSALEFYNALRYGPFEIQLMKTL